MELDRRSFFYFKRLRYLNHEAVGLEGDIRDIVFSFLGIYMRDGESWIVGVLIEGICRGVASLIFLA